MTLLLLLFSQSKNAGALQESNNSKKSSSGKDTIVVNLDNITVLNFDDYFSKIEIIPLESVNNISANGGDRFNCRNPMYVVTLDGSSYYLNINEKTEGYIIYQSDFVGGRNFFFNTNGRFQRVKRYNEYPDPVSVSIPDNIILDYKNKTVLPEAPWKIEGMDYITSMSDNQYVFPKNVYQSNRFVFIVTECMERTYYSFHDKQTQQTVTGIDLFSNGLLLPNIRVMSKGVLYGMVDPWDLDSAIDTVFLTDESKKRLSDIHLNDNSIIVKYYAK